MKKTYDLKFDKFSQERAQESAREYMVCDQKQNDVKQKLFDFYNQDKIRK